MAINIRIMDNKITDEQIESVGKILEQTEYKIRGDQNLEVFIPKNTHETLDNIWTGLRTALHYPNCQVLLIKPNGFIVKEFHIGKIHTVFEEI